MPLRMPSVNILQKYCPASKVVCMSKIYLQTFISYMLIKFKLCWVPGSPGLLGPCQRLVPGGRPVAGSAGPCLWSSGTLTFGFHPSALFGPSDGPGPMSVCLQASGRHRCSFPPSLSNTYVAKTQALMHTVRRLLIHVSVYFLISCSPGAAVGDTSCTSICFLTCNCAE